MPTFVDASNVSLLTDLYQLTMLQAYWREGMQEPAVFSLYFRHLPRRRNYVLACGLEDVLAGLEALRFDTAALDALSRLPAPDGAPLFGEGFLRHLEGFRVRATVFAVAEGTPVFANEPLLELVAPIGEAQLVESILLNQLHLESVLASKAARVVEAAAGRPVVDFGLRRMHGTDAALKGARAEHVAGIAATSNVLAGTVYGIPVQGTMAHSYVQAHATEEEAFRDFTRLYPRSVLLVDTYDTLEGIDAVIALAREQGAGFAVQGIRLDSGDLATLARAARERLDAAGLQHLRILASGDLDEERVAGLVAAGAPIDAFGVGTRMGVSEDAPALDLVYKLTSYAGVGRVKTSPGKELLPGRKQVFRVEERGEAVRDVIARDFEPLPGRPLLERVMAGGERLAAGRRGLAEARARARAEVGLLPARVRALDAAEPPYEVTVSPALRRFAAEIRLRVREARS